MIAYTIMFVFAQRMSLELCIGSVVKNIDTTVTYDADIPTQQYIQQDSVDVS